MGKQNIFEWLDEHEKFIKDIAQKIWDNPEAPMQEKYASNLQSSILEEAGFKIQRNIGGISTAFVAEYGSGHPILGVLGEYDALPGLSQAVFAKKNPIKEDGLGHGCGHNLLGTAGVGAVLAIKQAMDNSEITGTIRYYGCPAEETLEGKPFMAREGVFNDLDSCLTWHPMSINTVFNVHSSAVNSIRFKFHGFASHAAANPHVGRSALDGVELMNVGANYLREHIIDAARIHYSITNGGSQPNIVHPEAEVWYYIRAPYRESVDGVTERLIKIAKGAAMMTETEVEVEFLSGCYHTLSNDALGELLLKNMLELGSPHFTDEDLEFGKELEKTLSENHKRNYIKGMKLPDEVAAMTIHEGVAIPSNKYLYLADSTDVGDVCNIVPTAQFAASCYPVGTPGHTWQAVAAAGSSIGYKGMHFAAKTLAGSLYDLYKDNTIIEKAKNEFTKSTKGKSYKSPIPKGLKPPQY